MKITISHALVLSILLFLSCHAQVKTQAAKTSTDELHAGASAYKDGNYKEAQAHFEKALALDPSYKYTQLLIARSINSQYRLGDHSPANLDLARKAIAAYQKFLTLEPNSDIAFVSVAFLYESLRDDSAYHQWLEKPLTDPSVSNDKKSDIYTVLVSELWSCTEKFTYENKASSLNNPDDKQRFDKAKQCAVDGLTKVEVAISLNPKNSLAYEYKEQLYRELAKLARLEKQTNDANSYDKEAAAAHLRAITLKNGETETSDEVTKITGDAALDEVLQPHPKLRYLAAPIPIPQSP